MENRGGDDTIESLFDELEEPMRDAYNYLTAGYATKPSEPSTHPLVPMLKPTYTQGKHYDAITIGREEA